MSNQEKTIKIWIDGGSSGNPGKGAIAFVIEWDDKRKISALTLGKKVTNNEAEYEALLASLGWIYGFYLIEPSQYHLVIYSDSQLVVNQVNGLWQVEKEEFKKWLKELRNFLSSFKSWEIKWIPKEKNKICDSLVKLVLYKKL
jgi:ribonuclease HI